MRTTVLVFAISEIFGSSHFIPKLHPLSDTFIEVIGNKTTTWKAGRNFHPNTSMSYINNLTSGRCGPKEQIPKLLIKTHNVDLHKIPVSFDAREAWPECASIIGNIRDQAACGSCWAFGAVEAMSDRNCIHSNGTVKKSVSAEDLLDCCTDCGQGCDGGLPEAAWSHWAEKGIATGGNYGTTDGCKAYSIPPCEHYVKGNLPPCGDFVPTPACIKKCDNGSALSYDKELTYGSAYAIIRDVAQIQMEIMTNGPVQASFCVYDDFLSYKRGVYHHVSDNELGGHSVKILGWGVEDDVPYWLVANSWNEDWGDKGYFKILRGSNECGIETAIMAGIPVL